MYVIARYENEQVGGYYSDMSHVSCQWYYHFSPKADRIITFNTFNEALKVAFMLKSEYKKEGMDGTFTSPYRNTKIDTFNIEFVVMPQSEVVSWMSEATLENLRLALETKNKG